MAQTSELQQKFPLSPKKFWKKILQKIPGFIFSSVFFGFFIGFLSAFIIPGIFYPGHSTIGIPLSDFLNPFIIGIIIIFFLNVLLSAIYIKYYIKYYYYSEDKDFITIKKGVFSPAEIHIQYKKMQDVYVDQDVLDRVFGIYDVHFASATVGSAISAHIDGISEESANSLKEMVLLKLSGGSFNDSKPVSKSIYSIDKKETKITISETISSDIYGLSGKWLTMQLIKNILGSIPASLFCSLFIGLFPFRFIYLRSLSYISILSVIMPVFIIIGVFGVFLWKRNYKFSFEKDHFYYRTGILSIKESNMPYYSIQDMSITQSIFEKIFGLYSISIKNASAFPFVSDRGTQQAMNMSGFGGMLITGLSKESSEKISEVVEKILSQVNPERTGL